jgi:Fur family peroxide stress response transcriptional regulator
LYFMNTRFYQGRLKQKGLKVTPQRLAIFSAIYELNNHPTAEQIFHYIRKTHGNIALGTVYKVLETLADNALIKKVRTDSDINRYEPFQEAHHHLFDTQSDRIEDYYDKELDAILTDYFRAKGIKDFDVGEIRLHISGSFKR